MLCVGGMLLILFDAFVPRAKGVLGPLALIVFLAAAWSENFFQGSGLFFGGTYEISWGDGGNLVGGKGWNPGLNARYVSPKTDNRIVIRPRSFESLKAFLTPTS